jgi:hypothetical protein
MIPHLIIADDGHTVKIRTRADRWHTLTNPQPAISAVNPLTAFPKTRCSKCDLARRSIIVEREDLESIKEVTPGERLKRREGVV